jgi:hypothetical protein
MDLSVIMPDTWIPGIRVFLLSAEARIFCRGKKEFGANAWNT